MNNKEGGILRIVREDILRILAERDKSISLELIQDTLKVSNSFIKKAMDELKEENLIEFKNSSILLKDEGKIIAGEIIKRHLIIEDYFKETGHEKEAHKMTDILEHYVSYEVLNNIKRLSTFKEKGVPLTEFSHYRKGLITDITFFDYKLFERIVSMGIFPGGKIKIMHSIPDGMVVTAGSKKFALGKDIAKGIKVLE